MIKRFKLRTVCFLCLLSVSVVWTTAQETDYATRTKMAVKHEMTERVDLSAGIEWRTKSNLNMTDRWGLDLLTVYKLFPFLKIGVGYEAHYRNRGAEGWKFRNRCHLNTTCSVRWINLKFALRERFQYTWNEVENTWRLRSRLKLAYDIPDSRIEPYVYAELYNSLNRGEHFDIPIVCYTAGLSLPLFSDCWAADFYFSQERTQSSRKNIFGVLVLYKF